MIVNKRTGFAVDKKNIDLPIIRSDLKEIDETEWLFVMPYEISDNHLKVIYKVGFLKKLYNLIFPHYTNIQIWKIINTKWQVFVGIRQMERLWKKYNELYEKKKED